MLYIESIASGLQNYGGFLVVLPGFEQHPRAPIWAADAAVADEVVALLHGVSADRKFRVLAAQVAQQLDLARVSRTRAARVGKENPRGGEALWLTGCSSCSGCASSTHDACCAGWTGCSVCAVDPRRTRSTSWTGCSRRSIRSIGSRHASGTSWASWTL